MSEPNDRFGQPPRAFFGRRKGHPLKPRQAALFDTLLPRITLDLTKPAPADLRTLFGNVDEVRLEIGFGGAEHLLAQAKANPRIGFIASDGFINAIAKALAGIAADEAAARIVGRLLHQVFGAAIADFQPHVVERHLK